MTQEFRAPDLEGRFLPPGEVIADRFKLGEKIGQGPFGQVYRADDTLVETEVAVKVFDAAVSKSPLDEERFLKATRRARALTQKNVVRLHDSGVHNGHPWVSMQILEGLNLRKVIRLRRQRQEGFSLAEVEPLLSQITLALQHVGRDYPHGNLKPENVIFLPEFVKVTDNYVLSALGEQTFADRVADERFVAPELKNPGREPDARCDVYSMGMLVGFILFGDDYRPGDEADAPGALAAIDTLCRQATNEDPAQRYSTVEALNEDFTAAVDTGSLLTSPSRPVRPPGAEPIPETEETVVTAAPRRRRPQESPDETDDHHGGAGAEESRPHQTAAASLSAAGEAGVDPLDVETSPDIGTSPQSEVSPPRSAPPAGVGDDEEALELQDFLPTEEVDRGDGRPDPGTAPSGATPKIPDATVPPSLGAASKPKPERAERKPKPKASDDDPGPPLGILAGAAVVVALFLGVVVLALVLPSSGDDPGGETGDAVAQHPDPVDDDETEELDEDALAEEEQRKEEERKRKEEEEKLRQQLGEATALAVNIKIDAFDVALKRAEEEEERIGEEEEEEQEVAQAAAGAGEAPGGARATEQPAATQCPSGMVRFRLAGEFVCIDAYQYPGAGQTPRTNVSWFDARGACQRQGKRLCTLQEWQGACGSGYPYGASFNPDACNTTDADGFNRSLAEAGAFSQCRSHVGAYDMSGNVHEWVEEQRVAGGAFDSGPEMARCNYSSAMSAGNSRPNVGFRCCADPE